MMDANFAQNDNADDVDSWLKEQGEIDDWLNSNQLEMGEGRTEVTSNPDQPRDALKPKEPEVGYLQSLARGAAQGYTSFFSDEMTGLGESMALGTPYREARDESRKAYDIARRSNPATYGLGVAAGTLGQTLTPGLNIGGKLTPMAAGALQGGIAGYGISESDRPDEQGAETLKGITGGAAFGRIMGQMLPEAGPKLARSAEERAYKAAAGQSLSDLKREAAAGRVVQDEHGLSLSRGRDLLQKDQAGGPVVGWLSKTEDIAPRLSKKREFFGGKIGEVGKAVDETIPDGAVSMADISKSAQEQLSKLPRNRDTQALGQKVDQTIDSMFGEEANMSFADAQNQKNYFQWSPSKNMSMPADRDLHTILNNSLSRALEKGVEKAIPQADEQTAEILKQYRDYKSKYSTYAGADEQAFARSLQNLSNRKVSPSDYAAGLSSGSGTVAGLIGSGHSPVESALIGGGVGLGIGAINKFARERGSSFVARSSDAMARALESVPEVLGKYAPVLLEAQKRGAGQLMLTHQLLLKTKPDYLDTISKLTDTEESGE